MFFFFRRKVEKTASCCEEERKTIDLAKTMQLFLTNYHVLVFRWTFQQKVAQFVKKREKSSICPKLSNFSNKLPCLRISMNFSANSCKNCLISWKCTKNHQFGQNFATSRTNYHVFVFRWTFRQTVAKTASFRENARKINLAKTLQPLEQTTMSLFFDELFGKQLQKLPHFVKMHENSSIWPKLCNFFEQTTMFWCFDELFARKFKKVAQFVKNHEKSTIWPKLCNFLNKLPCLCIPMNFSANSCKNCLISWNCTKTHRFGQNCATFSNKLPCFGVSMNFSAESCKKWLNSWKTRKNHRFGQNFATSRTNYHVFVFRWTFRQTVAKTASFREKPRKLVDLAKTMQLFLTNYHVFVFRWTFQQKVAESGPIREKQRKIIDLANSLELFEQTTMSLHLHELFRRKLQKVPHFVKKHEKPSISQELLTFRANYHVSWKSTNTHRFGQNLQLLEETTMFWHFDVYCRKKLQKGGKSGSFREKWRKIIDLAKTLQLCEKTTMFWHFDEVFSKKKNTKSASFGEKARKIVDLAKTGNFSNKLPCFDALVNFSAKSCRKCLVFWENSKNHRLGQNLQLFRTKYHVCAFRWTFQQKVAKSAWFREQARKIIDLAKTCNFSNKLPCFGISMNFSGKKCKKWPVSWKSTNTHRFGQNLQLLEETTMFWHFDDYCRKKLQKGGKSGSSREKWRKVIDLA